MKDIYIYTPNEHYDSDTRNTLHRLRHSVLLECLRNEYMRIIYVDENHIEYIVMEV